MFIYIMAKSGSGRTVYLIVSKWHYDSAFSSGWYSGRNVCVYDPEGPKAVLIRVLDSIRTREDGESC